MQNVIAIPVGSTYTYSLTVLMQSTCKVAVVSTYPPKNCGLASFTAALLAQLRVHPTIMSGCEMGVIALSDPSDHLIYIDPVVHFDMRVDSVSALVPNSHLMHTLPI